MNIKKYKIDIDKINEVFNNERLLICAIDSFGIRGINFLSGINVLVYDEVYNFLFLIKDEIIYIILS